MKRFKITLLLLVPVVIVVLCFFDVINLSLLKYFIEILNNYSGVLGLFIGVSAVLFSYSIFLRTFRPILFIQIKLYETGNIASFYNLSIKNIGSVPAKDIRYEIADKSYFERNIVNPEYESNDDWNSINSIKERLSGEFISLGNNQEFEGYLCRIGGNKEEPFTSKDECCTNDIQMKITYKNLINNKEYVSFQNICAHKKEKSLTSSLLRKEDEVVKELKEIKKIINKKQVFFILKSLFKF